MSAAAGYSGTPLARKLGIGQTLLMGHGEVGTGGRERPATPCARFEGGVGAVGLHTGCPTGSPGGDPLIEGEAHAAPLPVG